MAPVQVYQLLFIFSLLEMLSIVRKASSDCYWVEAIILGRKFDSAVFVEKQFFVRYMAEGGMNGFPRGEEVKNADGHKYHIDCEGV